MSIARGLRSGTRIGVFDDATAAIDALTEHQVRMALRQVTEHKAVIIIAHRLSSLTHADEIIVLDKGCVIERGSHTELIAQGGAYAELYQLQAKPTATAARVRTPELQS
jgi:ATP-binding cassette subfamily B protein